MELHAFDRIALVPEAHHLALGRARAYFEAVRHRACFDQQRMVAHRLERILEPLEYRLAVMDYRRGLAMHQAARASHGRAESLTDALMAKAYAQNRDLAGHLMKQCNRNSRLRRSARARRDHDRVGPLRPDSRNVDRVVTAHDNFGPELAQILHEVVGERVVIVDHQYLRHGRHLLLTCARTLRNRAPRRAPESSRAPC